VVCRTKMHTHQCILILTFLPQQLQAQLQNSLVKNTIKIRPELIFLILLTDEQTRAALYIPVVVHLLLIIIFSCIASQLTIRSLVTVTECSYGKNILKTQFKLIIAIITTTSFAEGTIHENVTNTSSHV